MGSDKPPTICHVSKKDVIHSLDLPPWLKAMVKSPWCGFVHIRSPSAQLMSNSMSVSSVLHLHSLTRVNGRQIGHACLNLECRASIPFVNCLEFFFPVSVQINELICINPIRKQAKEFPEKVKNY